MLIIIVKEPKVKRNSRGKGNESSPILTLTLSAFSIMILSTKEGGITMAEGRETSFTPYLWESYTNWFRHLTERNKGTALFTQTLAPILAAEKEQAGDVFLSVILRTRGDRPEALREALLCLRAQSLQDLEVLLMVHQAGEKEKALVEQILREQEPAFREKIRCYYVAEGGRAHPLNLGFAHAHGRYITVYDDDDLITGDWAEAFQQAAKEAPASVLHAFCLLQRWDVIPSPEGEGCLRAVGAPQSLYCAPFNAILQMEENRCPMMSLCFPRQVMDVYGFCFDENLTVYEGWDFLMRVALIFGVRDICTPTGTYRRWVNEADSSQVPEEEWERNYQIVREKLRRYMLLLPTDYLPAVMGIPTEIYIPTKDPVQEKLLAEKDAALAEKDRQIQARDEQLAALTASTAWKVGRRITWLPRMLRSFCRTMKTQGLRTALGKTVRKVLPRKQGGQPS